MTPTKDDALAALDYLYSRATMRLDQIETEMNYIGHSSPMAISEIRHFIQCAKQALTQPPVDVEALKIDAREDVYHRQKNIAAPDVVQDIVWDCIDYLVSKGYLK